MFFMNVYFTYRAASQWTPLAAFTDINCLFNFYSSY